MKYLILDNETSGLIDNSSISDKYLPEITEFFGHVIDETGYVYRELHFLCKPREPVSAKIEKITGITNEMLKNEPPFSDFADDVADIIEHSDAVVAHNLLFDMSMINIEFKRLKDTRPIMWPSRQICTVAASEFYKGYRLKLSDLHEYYFDEPYAGAHRANVDVQALTRCFLEMLRRGDV